MKKLYISGETVLLDDDDYEIISAMTGWYILKNNDKNTYYVRHRQYGLLHRFILKLDQYDNNNFNIVDHIDKNGLNNQKSNLRVVNAIVNGRNRNACKKNKFNFNGLSYQKPGQSYKFGAIQVSYTINERYLNNPNRFKSKTKKFSISKYNFDYNKAVRDAVLFRIEMMKKYGYTVDERSETIEKRCLEENYNMEEILGISFKDIFGVE